MAKHHGRFPHARPPQETDRRYVAVVTLAVVVLMIILVLAGVGVATLLGVGP